MPSQNIIPANKTRLIYIDQLRGFAMITVVLSHLFNFSFGQNNSVIANYFIVFYMPLFFYISGFVRSNKEDINSTKELLELIAKKFRQFIIPTVFFFCIYEWLIANNWHEDLFHRSKGGYWFLIGLFYINVLYNAITLLFKKLNIAIVWKEIVCVILGLFFLSLHVINSIFFGNGNTDVLSLTKISFFLYYVLGVLVKNHYNDYNKLVQNQIFLFMLIIISILGYVFFTKYDLLHGLLGLIISSLLSISSVILWFELFKKYGDIIEKKTCYLSKIGCRTLDIYLIHWFVLPRGLDIIGDFFAAANSPFIYFLIGILFSCIVLVFSYFISSVLRLSSSFSYLFLGTK